MSGEFSAKRRLNAKGLPAPQATTVLALKSLRAEDDAKIVQLVCELAAWGMRPALITSLVGNAAQTMVKAMCEKAQGRLSVGRVPTTIGVVLAHPLTHLEASIYLRKFIGYQRMEGGSRGNMIEAFINAYRDYRTAITWKTKLPPRLLPDYAHILAKQYVERQAMLSPCPTCGVHFVQSAISIKVSYATTRGACPYCRLNED